MFNALIEAAFRRAQENGDLDDLPGAGKPIAESSLTADPFAHVYAESGAMTPFSEVQRQIEAARARLAEAGDAGARKAIRAEISALETRKAVEMETWRRYG
ncbi:hypothetical protein A3731_32060 [Roseovarius sp. HI0049]|nr:hypothetical protein A3731_09890 [Roseovarius sp. HI0049]KZY46415.1 hypothetical protein A3731_32060 [Roseovarius sp. HI0049]